MLAQSQKQSTKKHKVNVHKVHLESLDPAWSEDDIRSFMTCFGNIQQVAVIKNKLGRSKGYGFVIFSAIEEAKASIGKVSYKGQVVEVKLPSRNYKDKGKEVDPKSPKNKHSSKVYKYQKELSKPTKSYAEDSTFSSPNPTTSTRKLSKNSKLFVTSVDSTSAGSLVEARDVTVNVIKIRSSTDYLSLDNLKTNIPEDLPSRKTSEKQGTISKFSKEFHPTVNNSNPSIDPEFTSPLTLGPHQLPTDFNVQTSQSRCLQASSAIKIAFFTFPGRD